MVNFIDFSTMIWSFIVLVFSILYAYKRYKFKEKMKEVQRIKSEIPSLMLATAIDYDSFIAELRIYLFKYLKSFGISLSVTIVRIHDKNQPWMGKRIGANHLSIDSNFDVDIASGFLILLVLIPKGQEDLMYRLKILCQAVFHILILTHDQFKHASEGTKMYICNKLAWNLVYPDVKDKASKTKAYSDLYLKYLKKIEHNGKKVYQVDRQAANAAVEHVINSGFYNGLVELIRQFS